VSLGGLGVNAPSSFPEVTAIGGTSFLEGTGAYWSSTTQDDGTSALSYIPERGWNETIQGVVGAGGGGISGFCARPSWQTGAGVANDNSRHVPDIAFTAASGHDPYAMIMRGVTYYVGGTSAGTPLFAGVLALLNQYLVNNGTQPHPGLGSINPRLYQFAQSAPGCFTMSRPATTSCPARSAHPTAPTDATATLRRLDTIT
jgi:subtilase family serine protease